jgi:hypothetical protein
VHVRAPGEYDVHVQVCNSEAITNQVLSRVVHCCVSQYMIIQICQLFGDQIIVELASLFIMSRVERPPINGCSSDATCSGAAEQDIVLSHRIEERWYLELDQRYTEGPPLLRSAGSRHRVPRQAHYLLG